MKKRVMIATDFPMMFLSASLASLFLHGIKAIEIFPEIKSDRTSNENVCIILFGNEVPEEVLNFAKNNWKNAFLFLSCDAACSIGYVLREFDNVFVNQNPILAAAEANNFLSTLKYQYQQSG